MPVLLLVLAGTSLRHLSWGCLAAVLTWVQMPRGGAAQDRVGQGEWGQVRAMHVGSAI